MVGIILRVPLIILASVCGDEPRVPDGTVLGFAFTKRLVLTESEDLSLRSEWYGTGRETEWTLSVGRGPTALQTPLRLA